MNPELMVQEELERRELEAYEEQVEADIRAHERYLASLDEDMRDIGCECEGCLS